MARTRALDFLSLAAQMRKPVKGARPNRLRRIAHAFSPLPVLSRDDFVFTTHPVINYAMAGFRGILDSELACYPAVGDGGERVWD